MKLFPGSIALFTCLFLIGCYSNQNTVEERFAGDDTGDKGPTDYYSDQHIRYRNYTYQDSIKTVRLHKKGWEQGPPIIELGNSDRLLLSFDELGQDVSDLSYTIIHCNADWMPSDLMESEYLKGFYEDYITDDAFSFNTLQPYTHYELTIPNEDIGITKSGNYILHVYRNDGNKTPVLTRRFMVHENKNIKINADIHEATRLDHLETGQEVDFSIQHPEMRIQNPFRDLKVVVLKNFRWDNAKFGLDPKFVRENELVYDYSKETMFQGGNEYREFDIKSLRYQTQEVQRITRDSASFSHVHLLPDEPRVEEGYYSQPDINGRYLIRNDEGGDPALSSDYVHVHFTLKRRAPFHNGDVQIFGELSDYGYGNDFRMDYDHEEGAYKAELYLKQGYYNYQYMFLENEEQMGDLTAIEGSHYETENDYTILVYYRLVGSQYDQLIGVRTFNSRKH